MADNPMQGAHAAPRGKANGNCVHGAHAFDTQLAALLGRLTNREARDALNEKP